MAGDAGRDLEDLVVAAVLRAAPTAVLDFGCGGGRLVLGLAAGGISAVGYDPQPSHCWSECDGARFTSDRAAAAPRRV